MFKSTLADAETVITEVIDNNTKNILTQFYKVSQLQLRIYGYWYHDTNIIYPQQY